MHALKGSYYITTFHFLVYSLPIFKDNDFRSFKKKNALVIKTKGKEGKQKHKYEEFHLVQTVKSEGHGRIETSLIVQLICLLKKKILIQVLGEIEELLLGIFELKQ